MPPPMALPPFLPAGSVGKSAGPPWLCKHMRSANGNSVEKEMRPTMELIVQMPANGDS